MQIHTMFRLLALGWFPEDTQDQCISQPKYASFLTATHKIGSACLPGTVETAKALTNRSGDCGVYSYCCLSSKLLVDID